VSAVTILPTPCYQPGSSRSFIISEVIVVSASQGFSIPAGLKLAPTAPTAPGPAETRLAVFTSTPVSHTYFLTPSCQLFVTTPNLSGNPVSLAMEGPSTSFSQGNVLFSSVPLTNANKIYQAVQLPGGVLSITNIPGYKTLACISGGNVYFNLAALTFSTPASCAEVQLVYQNI